MDYVNLGNTGLRVSRVCLGMMSYGKHESREWTIDDEAAGPIVRRAVEGGIPFFDPADAYNACQREITTGTPLKQPLGVRGEAGFVGHNAAWRRRARLANDGGSDGVVGRAVRPARILRIAGTQLDEPITQYGPFVMNTKAEIMQAVADYQAGEFTVAP